jgi:hypothetical protein
MNNKMRLILVWCLLSLLSSCGLLIDFPDPSGITYCPDTENQVLTAQQKPAICFDFEVDKDSVEALISIKDTGGALQGYCLWDDQTVYFHAQPELIPGRRYVFSFFGTFNDARGAACSVHHIVPFYFQQRDESAPYVLSCEPRPGETIACTTPIRILFSEAVEPASLARGLGIEPDTPIGTSWEKEQTEVLLTPEQYWPHCACLAVEVDEAILDIAGIPLAEARRFVFWVQEDIVSPAMVSVQPVRNDPAELFPPTGAGIQEPLGLREGLRITFSEAMDCVPTAGALILQPSAAITRMWIDPSRLVVLPLEGFAPATEYCLRFGDEAADPAGNPISSGESVLFNTIAGAITVDTELVNDGIGLGPQDYSTAAAIEIHPYPITTTADYVLSFRFSNARFDSNTEKKSVQDAIDLLCLFPDSGVTDPIPTGFSWSGDFDLSITFSELQPSMSSRRVYYLLRIRGGAGGISTEEGFRLEEDLEQLLVTAVE